MIRRVRVPLLMIIAMASIMSVVSQAQSQALLTHHTREAVVDGQAQFVGRLPANKSMQLDVVLALQHQSELKNFLQELYEPSSASYRKFLTVEEFTERFGPSQQDYDTLIGFAKANGFTVVKGSRNRMEVQVKGSVATIEKAFHVTMGVYQHPTEDRTFYAPDREPTVDLPFQLWHISGLDNYSIPHPLFVHKTEQTKSNAQTGSGPDDSFLGSDMRAAYYEGTSLTGAGQSLGLFEYLGTDLADLNTYYKNVGQTEAVPITLLSVDGTPTSCVYADGCDDTEQTIDMTQSLGMAPGMASLVMYIGSTDTAIFNAMATASPLNAQLSCSWYWTPADPQSLDPIFETFAAQGQNLFDAAGDHQSWQIGGSIWPADDAYLVSVGGTDLETQSAGGPWASETAWSDGGGGISPNNIPIPSWQVATAAGCSDCSQTLRNGPDVSANSNFTFYVCADQTTCSANEYGGTSFAAPMWAGYLALVNQQGAANGNSPLGFINPALYTIGLGPNYDSDFHDITSGSNGYPATVGYDLATGWGSPNGDGLINALGGPSSPTFILSAKPSSVTVVQGYNASTSITVTELNGFTNTVSLSTSTLPSGVTAVFNPNPATTSSTLTFTASATATTGTSTVTVTGMSGSITQTTMLSLTVDTVAESPGITLSPTSETFTKTEVGETSTAKTINVRNTGGSTLNITSIVASADFTLVPVTTKKACGSTLAAGATCQVKVSFTPTQGGALTGMLSFNDNALNSPQSVALSGTGIALNLSPTSLNFGNVAPGATSAPLTVTVTNEGSSTVTFTGFKFTGAKDFAISNNTCGSTIGGGSSCAISVDFTPPTKGYFTGHLEIESTGGGSPQSVSLSGDGT